jgi:hypothetical protein
MAELEFPLGVDINLIKRGLEEAVRYELNRLQKTKLDELSEAVQRFEMVIALAEEYDVNVNEYLDASLKIIQKNSRD